MESVTGSIFFIVQILIILYVIFSLAVMNHKLNTIMKYFDIDEENQNHVSNEEIEQELEEQMDKT